MTMLSLQTHDVNDNDRLSNGKMLSAYQREPVIRSRIASTDLSTSSTHSDKVGKITLVYDLSINTNQ